MRITGGKARGIQLKTPKGDLTRPATDRMRESVFSSLGPSIEDCRVADLFAGTGSYGLEALSRGAASASFYEVDRNALHCLKQNTQAVLRSCEIDTSYAKVITRDIFSLHAETNTYDLIFCDPPYSIIEERLPEIFSKVIAQISSETTRVIVELPGNLEPSISGWKLSKRLGKVGKGKPTIAIFQKA
ncbi:MAG: 16S rRNA (guanine(966)-N(2))-methyltransferase RsmD [Opitutaceae bacterium]